MNAPRPQGIPPVTVNQWLLAGICLLLSLVSYVTTGYLGLRVLVMFLTLFYVLLTLDVALEALRFRYFGKLLLVAGTLFFFWVEGVYFAFEDYVVPSGLPVPAGQFSIGLVRLAHVYVAIFGFMCLVGYATRVRARPITNYLATRVDDRRPLARTMTYVLVACAVIPLALSYGGISEATDALIAARSSGAPGTVRDLGLLSYIFFFGIFGASVMMLEGIVFGATSRIRKIVFAGLAFLPFVMQGVRHLWLFVALPVFIAATRQFKGRVTRGMLRWIAAGLLIILVVQLQLLVRTIGWRSLDEISPLDVLQGNRTGQFTALLVAEALVPQAHGYFYSPAEPFFVIHWIPRAIWQDKPVMPAWQFYNDEYTGGAETFNVTPSVIGQYHMNWGVAGVFFIGWWLGFLSKVADVTIASIDVSRQRAAAVVVGMFYAFLVSSFRFYSPIYFTYFAFGLVAMLVVTRPAVLRTRALPEPEPA